MSFTTFVPFSVPKINLSGEELVNMMYVFGECNKNCLLASRVYAARYPTLIHPEPRAFERVRLHFERTKSVLPPKRVRLQRKSNEEVENEVMQRIVEDPHISVRKIKNEIGVSKSSVHRIIQKNKFHPYHIQLLQEIDETDKLNRRQFCEWINNQIEIQPTFSRFILFTDEATFHKNGYVNRHNFHYYDDSNPHFSRPVDHQHRWSLNVWAGILDKKIIGPYFFDRNITGEIYLHFLRNDLENYLDDLPLNTVRRIWFQQDGAPPHFSIQVRQYLNNRFPDRWIGRRGPINWPARSPDLTKLDFFLWGYIKDIVFQQPPTTIVNMKERIREAIEGVTESTLIRVDQSFRRRMTDCIRANGGHIENI